MSCLEALKKPRSETPPGLPLLVVVAVALINPENKILIGQRPWTKPMAGLWEFPGGKVREGESPEFALARELAEELGIETRETCFAPLGFASHSYEDFHLLMPLYACRMWHGTPQPLEHLALEWVSVQDLTSDKYPMPPADVPLLYQIRDRL